MRTIVECVLSDNGECCTGKKCPIYNKCWEEQYEEKIYAYDSTTDRPLVHRDTKINQDSKE